MSGATAAQGAVIVVNRRGYIAGWNEGAEALLGHRAPDVVGRACHHVLCGRKPEGVVVCHPWCELAPAEQRGSLDAELVLYPRTVNGETLRVVLSVFPVENEDEARGWIVHTVTSAELFRRDAPAVSPTGLAWSLRRRGRNSRISEIGQN